MFTLIYNNGEFNRSDTLLPYLQSNVGEWPLIQIDCITPFVGTEKELIQAVCEYLGNTDPCIDVVYNLTQNCSTERTGKGTLVHYLVIQIHVILSQ